MARNIRNLRRSDFKPIGSFADCEWGTSDFEPLSLGPSLLC